MTYTSISEKVTQHVMRAIRSSRLVALALVATFASMALQPAQAQSSDTWKSIAIIGGYAIDKRRRANEYYNQYGDNGYYGTGAPYSGDDGGYYGNGGYNGPYDNGGSYPYPSGYQSNNYYRNSNRFSRRR